MTVNENTIVTLGLWAQAAWVTLFIVIAVALAALVIAFAWREIGEMMRWF